MSGRSLCMSWLHFKKFFFTTELTRTAMVLLCFFRLTSALSIGRHLIQVTRSMIENVSTSLSELCYISTVLQGQQLVLSMHLALCRFLVGALGECWVQDFRQLAAVMQDRTSKAHVQVRTDQSPISEQSNHCASSDSKRASPDSLFLCVFYGNMIQFQALPGCPGRTDTLNPTILHNKCTFIR